LTFLLDANVLVYSATESHRRTACTELLDAVIRDGAEGRTSVGVLEEVWHIELSRELGISGLTERMALALRPLLPVSESTLRNALGLGGRAGAFDRLHVGTCREYGIETIVSADHTFDGIAEIRRVDPLDSAAVAALIEG
jgi:predicted nucleic acid-binding protein